MIYLYIKNPFCVAAYCFKDILKRESGVSLMSQVSSQLAKKDLKGRYPLGMSSGILAHLKMIFSGWNVKIGSVS